MFHIITIKGIGRQFATLFKQNLVYSRTVICRINRNTNDTTRFAPTIVNHNKLRCIRRRIKCIAKRYPSIRCLYVQFNFRREVCQIQFKPVCYRVVVGAVRAYSLRRQCFALAVPIITFAKTNQKCTTQMYLCKSRFNRLVPFRIIIHLHIRARTIRPEGSTCRSNQLRTIEHRDFRASINSCADTHIRLVFRFHREYQRVTFTPNVSTAAFTRPSFTQRCRTIQEIKVYLIQKVGAGNHRRIVPLVKFRIIRQPIHTKEEEILIPTGTELYLRDIVGKNNLFLIF